MAAGFTAGGFFYGEKQWEKAPKEYVATAKCSFQVRPPIRGTGAGSEGGVIGSSSDEVEVIRQSQSHEALMEVVSQLELAQKSGVPDVDLANQLLSLVMIEHDREARELLISVTWSNPEEAAAIANEVASAVPKRIVSVDQEKKGRFFQSLDEELEPYFEREKARAAELVNELAKKGITVTLQPGVNLDAYLDVPEILAAKLAWDAALKEVDEARSQQTEFSNYWNRPLRPSMVTMRAEPPQFISGPELRGFQIDWAVYGVTTGILLGLILMVACWKLFP